MTERRMQDASREVVEQVRLYSSPSPDEDQDEGMQAYDTHIFLQTSMGLASAIQHVRPLPHSLPILLSIITD